jgi:hypothetical protein
MAVMSTRSSGHGIPWLLSSGNDGDVRMRGDSGSFFGLRRKENMSITEDTRQPQVVRRKMKNENVGEKWKKKQVK